MITTQEGTSRIMKRILITGACGSIGRKLVTELLKKNNKVCAFDNNEDGLFILSSELRKNFPNTFKVFIGDIRDKERVMQAMSGIDEVYHCAALKHVELSEYNPFEAIKTNINGTQNIIDCAIQSKVCKVLVTSSDKAVNPSSMMGSSKLLAEKIAVSANNFSGTDSISFGCVRFGNVWDTNGSVGRIFKSQVQNKQDLTVTSTEMTRFFILIEDAISLCINSMEEMIGGEIFISDMGAISIGELACAFTEGSHSSNILEMGLKPGEKLYEELFTDVESFRTYLFKDMYVVLPDNLDKDSTRLEKLYEKYTNPLPSNTPLRSDSKIAKEIDPNMLVDRIMK